MVSMFKIFFLGLKRSEPKIACFEQGDPQGLRNDKTGFTQKEMQVVKETIPAQLVRDPVPAQLVEEPIPAQLVEEPIPAQVVRNLVPENTFVAKAVLIEDAVAEPASIVGHIDDQDNTNEPVATASEVVQAVQTTTQQLGGTTDQRSHTRARRALHFLKFCKYLSVGALCGILIATGLVSGGALPFLIMGSVACVYTWVIAQKTSEDIQMFVL